MNINSHILNAGGRLKSVKSTIENTSKTAIKLVTGHIPVDKVDVVFMDSAYKTIKHLGFGGYTWTKNLIMIPIDPKFSDIDNSLKNNLTRTIAHELYHVLRNYTFEKESTLLESMINEGLADHFELEIAGGQPEKWDVALTEDQIDELLKRAEKEYNNKKYDHNAWFFGSEKENIPYWTGYALGFNLVKKYLEKHPNSKPSTVYKLSAKEFI